LDLTELMINLFVIGAYMFGTGNHYGAEYFMDQDVVLVTLNYRLGALGKRFLCACGYIDIRLFMQINL